MLKPALMFKDHMILQRDKKIAVWGMGDPGTKVNVTVQGQVGSATVGNDGNWNIMLEPLAVSFSEDMVIQSGDEKIVCTDVQVGDVWFAGGQSNMEFFMRYDADMSREKENCTNPNIRFFDYPEVAYVGQIDEADYGKNYGIWRLCEPDQLQWFSAVGYYFAKDLQAKYQVPIGILGCNLGGSPACAWLPKDVVAANGNQYRLDEYEAAIASLDFGQYTAKVKSNPQTYKVDQMNDPLLDLMMSGCELEEMMAKSMEMMREAGIDVDNLSPEEFMIPMGPLHEWRPCGLYESMLLPCIPYGVKGILWFQGCSDAENEKQANAYKQIFTALIKHWRGLWEEELPFLFVQLAPFGQWMMNTGDSFPIVREAQQWAADHIPGTGMAVATDVGMENDIHPKKKQPVGHRLALLAERLVYGEQDVICEAPTLVSAQAENGRIVLTFDNTGDGLKLTETVPYGQVIGADVLGGLEIFQNGEKLESKNLKATAEGDQVLVTGEEIRGDVPTEIRIAKTGWFLVNLYNSADIPARPAVIRI